MEGQHGPIRVLLVENNQDDAQLLQDALDFAGDDLFEVYPVRRLAQAQEFVEHNDVDVVLLDLFLPDSFGLGTLVRFLEGAPHIPVVATTSLKSEEFRRCARQLGARAFFCKATMDGVMLQEALQEALWGGLVLADPNVETAEPTMAPAPPAAGQIIHGRWLLESLLAEGGMGLVYRGRELGTGAQVAVKFVHPTAVVLDEQAQARFLREATILAELDHPNIPALLDYGINPHSGMPYMVTEFMQGRTLCERFAEVQSQPLTVILGLIIQILRALEVVHSHDIVHRDIKPSNIFLEELPAGKLRVRLFDFGISRYIDPSEREEQYFGTPEYMPPEQIYGEPVDHRADLYALGVVAYELLTGRTPFKGTLLQIFQQQQLGAPSISKLWALREATDERVIAVVDWMMAFDKTARPGESSHIREILAEIQAARRWYDGRPEPIKRPKPPVVVKTPDLPEEILPIREPGLTPWQATGVLVCATLFVSSLIYILWLLVQP